MPYIGNKYEIGDHNNSWKPLDDISSYVATFDGSATNAVSTTNNTIRVPEHRFIQGQRVTYSNGGGGNIGGLTSGTAYYIIHDTNNEFKLATSLVNANNSTAINLSAVGSGSSHTITAAFDGVNKKFKITYSGGRSSRFTSATQLTVAINNIVQRANDTATFTDGFGISDNEKIVFNVAPVAADIFWGNILSASLPTFDISDNKLDNFTGNGSTTDFTLSHIPANNESIIVTVNGVVQHPTDKNGTRAYSLDASVLVFTAAPANGDEIQVRHIGFAGATTSAVTGFYGRTGNVTLSSSADDAIVGVITATKFSGPFVGTITGGNDIVAGIITATKIDLNGDIDVDGHTNLDNVSIAGVTTATGAIDLNADLDVDGHTNLDNVSVAGVSTLTGNVTIQSDFKFANQSIDNAVNWGKVASILQVRDGSKLTLGNSNDLQLYHNNLWNYIDNIGTKNFVIRVNGTDNALVALPDGQTSLYYSGDEKIQTTNTGSVVTGILTATDFSGAAGGAADFPNGLTGTTATFSGNVSIGGTLTYEDVTNVDAVGLITARAGIEVTGGTLKLPAVLQTNTDVDCKVLYQHNDNVIHGGSTLNWNPAYDTLKVNSNLISANSMYGAGGTLKVAASNHSSTSYVLITDKVEIGGLVGIGTNNPESGQLQVIGNGYHQINISGNKTANANKGGGISFLNYEGDRTSLVQTYSSNSSNTIYYGSADSSARGVQYHNFYVNTSRTATSNHALALRIDSSGHVTPGVLGTQNFGSTSKGWGNVYIADDKQLTLGNDSNLYIKHSNGHANNFIVSSVGDIEHHMALSKKIIKGFNNSGTPYVNLYQGDNNIRLTTTATGIEVTGEVAASQDYPNFRPTFDFNLAGVKKLDSRITYTRTGPASYVDEYGKVVLVGNNTPRFDHDPVTRESRGLLIEPARTNQMIYSSDITGDGVQNGTVTGDATTAPDGTTTADKYAANSTNGIHRIDMPFTSGQISNSTAYTFSVFVKANGYDKLHIRYGGYNADNHGLGYDLSDGTTFAGKYDGTSALGGVTSSSMVAYPNGWYRCSFTFTTASDSASGVAQMFYYISNSESTTNFAGDGSSGMYFWGAQMEVGGFVTSYVPTNGTTATRGGDVAYLDGTAGTEFDDIYRTDEGTFIIDWFNNPDGNHNDGYVFTVDDGTGNNRIGAVNSNSYQVTVTSGGSSQGTRDLGSINSGANKISLAYKLNDQATSLNGSDVSVDTSCTLPTGVNYMWFGLRQGQYDFLGGYISRIVYYTKRLPNNQLKTLSS